ncbi:hypothetical protein M405DRAFT_807442 [Rhizopogon salebrosus TDB-379]|nr:hypothetical protein M405DRAFT_807442 [Rhizopogon salebrosus TDB-379]
MAAPKLYNLLALASVAILAITSGPTSVSALATDRSHVARYAGVHDAVVKRKRDSTASSTSGNGRCKPQPTTSSSSSSSTYLSDTSSPTPSDTPTPSLTPSPTPSPTPSVDTTTSTSASASATPSSTGSSGGKKWGLAWPNGDTDYLVNFATRPNVGFIYTWSPYLPENSYGLEAIPMLWGYDQIGDFQNLVVNGYAKYVLGMNEPNEPSQSNMSPQDGASLWQQYINPLKDEGYYLISPACTNDQAGLDWMASFFESCSGCQVDAIAFHFYSNDAQAFISYATQLHNLYNKPIWVTEFADQNFSGTGGQDDQDQVYAFANTIISFVDSTDWMEAAFPFGAMYDLQGVNQANALLSNGYPTSLGYDYYG